METVQRFCMLSAVFLFPVAALGGDVVYRSLDDAGQVTYSAEPPAGAVTVEQVQLPAGPSDEDVSKSVERAKEMEQDADAGYKAMMERRQQEADTQREANETAEAGERKRLDDESLEDSAAEPIYAYPWYRGDWPRPHPPRPPIPPRPPLRGNR